MTPSNPIAELTFETAMSELETIVSKLERGDVTLDESIKLYERGEGLKLHCDTLLRSAEMKIEKIVLDAQGQMQGVQLVG